MFWRPTWDKCVCHLIQRVELSKCRRRKIIGKRRGTIGGYNQLTIRSIFKQTHNNTSFQKLGLRPTKSAKESGQLDWTSKVWICRQESRIVYKSMLEKTVSRSKKHDMTKSEILYRCKMFELGRVTIQVLSEPNYSLRESKRTKQVYQRRGN